MSQTPSEYAAATRHPWACVLFVLPLLVVYEAGVVLLGTPQSDALRNGADTWIRWTLAQIGLAQPYWPGIFVACGLVAWGWWARENPPREMLGVWMGMAIESGLFAVSLWGISAGLGRFLDVVHLPLNLNSSPDPALQYIISFLGAGVYEELLFRLLLLSLLYQLFQLGDLSPATAGTFAVIISALLFATAHHAGSAGEPFDGHIFLFRTLAGVFFALLMQWRGFGVTVGAHAGYDVLVGVVLPCA